MTTLGNITLHNADCMEILKTLPDKAFDLAIVDPPYGLHEIAVKTRGAGTLKDRIFRNGCIDKWDTKPPKEYFDELFRVSKNQIIWGGNYFDLPPTRCVIAWDKCQPWQNFSQWEMAWTSYSAPAKLFRFDNRGGEKKIHPTQKPVELYKWLLATFAKSGDKILDTHLGSGSIAIACDIGGFDLTGIEINQEFYDNAVARLKAHRQQQSLF